MQGIDVDCYSTPGLYEILLKLLTYAAKGKQITVAFISIWLIPSLFPINAPLFFRHESRGVEVSRSSQFGFSQIYTFRESEKCGDDLEKCVVIDGSFIVHTL